MIIRTMIKWFRGESEGRERPVAARRAAGASPLGAGLVMTFAISALLTPAGSAAAEELVLYSGRSKSLVQPIIERFTQETGIEVRVKYGGTSQLAVALMAEGERSPADVFWAQDAGALGALDDAGLLAPLPDGVAEAVDPLFAHGGGRWVPTSGRLRTLAYAPSRVDESELPDSVFDLTDPKYAGRVAWAPTNASFQAFVTAMRQVHGDEKTLAWLEGMRENSVRAYANNTSIIRAIASGEADLGLPNHYYLLRFKKSDGAYPVEQTLFEAGDVGNLLNVAGVAKLKTSRNESAAERFIRFLLSPVAQQYFASETMEYPVTEDVIAPRSLLGPEQLRERSPQVDLERLDDLEGTLALLKEAGLL